MIALWERFILNQFPSSIVWKIESLPLFLWVSDLFMREGYFECKFFVIFPLIPNSTEADCLHITTTEGFSHSRVSRVSGISTIFSLLIKKRALQIFLEGKMFLKGLMTTCVTETKKILNFFCFWRCHSRLYILALKFCNLWRDSVKFSMLARGIVHKKCRSRDFS